MLVVLDRGHGNKGDGRIDPGVVSGGLREIDLAQVYMDRAKAELESRGHLVLVCPEGSYTGRHRWAIAEAAKRPKTDAIYVQCHVNAGGGKYGVVEHDYRSKTWGRQAAAALADALDELPEVPDVRVWDLDPSERGWVCIDDVYASPTMCAVLYEPFFIDGTIHQPLTTPHGLWRVGNALAEGIDRYARVCAARKAA